MKPEVIPVSCAQFINICKARMVRPAVECLCIQGWLAECDCALRN